MVAKQLSYYPTVTRETYAKQGRITDLIRGGQLFDDLGLQPLDAERDRVMLCGSPAMIAEVSDWVEDLGFAMGNNAAPGSYVIEKAFVEK